MARCGIRRQHPRRFTEEVIAGAEARIRQGWTPEIICGRARLEKRPSVCKETIYTHIYKDAKAGGDLWTHLPRAGRKRRRRCPRLDGRGPGRIPNQRMIDTRPAEVETRATVGHWEGDLIQGAQGSGYLVTLVERKTRFSLIGSTAHKGAEEVTDEISSLFAGIAKTARTGLTVDNRKQFAWHEKIARLTGMDVYFARPYHSWERGTNENTNGLIRRLHPKGASFSGIGEAELKQIDMYLNDRPRKCLGWQTPREAMEVYLSLN